MTTASKEFVTPLSVELAAGTRPCSDLFESPLSHISLPKGADAFIIAPATANIIAKYAYGIADDFLSTALLAFRGPVLIAPAMNWRMWDSPILQQNLNTVITAGAEIIAPEKGSLACGEEGIGKMASIETIIESLRSCLCTKDLSGQKIIVTAGPTREYLDPVKFISNRSSGKMGFALATVAKRRGADVALISGPVSLDPPEGVRLLRVETAQEMRKTVMEEVLSSTILVMAAAVADFCPAEQSAVKLDKQALSSLSLVKTPDILAEVGMLKGRPFVVGFSAETGWRLDRAREKLSFKKCDMIVFNNVMTEGSGFNVDTNEVILIDKKQEKKVPLMSKEEVAGAIFDRIRELIAFR
jgi:phosphopantothenoylcysteine decarboxylase/phosphopantothenate--cysteine ligase